MFEHVKDNDMEGIFRTNNEGKIIETNDAFVTILSSTKDKVLTQNIKDLLVVSEDNIYSEIMKDIEIKDASNRIVYFKGNKTENNAFALSSVKLTNTVYIHSTKNIGVFIKDVDTIKYNEEKYKLLYNNNPLMLFTISLDGIILEVNPQAITQLGYTVEELIGHSVFNIFHPEEHQKVKETIDNFIITEAQAKPWEFKKITKSGNVLWVSETAKIINDDKQEKVIFIVCQDISARKEIEIEQYSITERLSLACKAGKIGIWEFDARSGELLWDEQMMTLFDYNKEEFTKSLDDWKKRAHDDDREPTLIKFSSCIEKRIDFDAEFRIVWRNGQIRNIRALAKVILNAQDEVVKIVGVNWDITEVKNTEIELIKKQERLNLALQGAGDGLWDWDMENGTVYYSPSWETMFGYEVGSTKPLFETFASRVHPDDAEKMYAEVNKYLKGESATYSYEFRMFRIDGSLIWTLHRAVALFNEDGVPTRMIGTATDTTYRKQTEESLRNIQYQLEERVEERTAELAKTNEILKNDIQRRMEIESELTIAKEKAEESEKLKTSFLQNLSHEIRTPMNGIIGFAQLLENPFLSEDKRKNYTSVIMNSSNQLMSIVTDVLTISSLETNLEKVNLQPVNINTLIIDLLSIFKSQSSNQNVALFTKKALPDRDAEILTDSTKITQILTNLLSNAVKFTHEGTIEYGYTLEDNNMLKFFVHDTGIGIAKENHQNIFQRFRQADLSSSRKYGGTGLGLSISQGFAELLGSKIELESELGKGSTFTFSIPYSPLNERKVEIITENIKTPKVKKSILIVEDDEINYFFLEELIVEEIIKDSGFEIIHAKNGQEAVDFCREDNSIELVLMDIRLPIMNGLEATKEIRKFKPNLVIIAQSAFALDIEREMYDDAVFNHYLAKPFKIPELKKTLDLYIGKKQVEINEN